ncbi:hypothetical protein L596_028716 [Steinernema carpocapsae]|uniref:Transporter n=1 Tax=Steinernema carpocapsae TaxID=34508 RepID=A0A4U5LZ59_STECR|nr:hypothetical protein L596_028716 [Steinernema carpocapsae]
MKRSSRSALSASPSSSPSTVSADICRTDENHQSTEGKWNSGPPCILSCIGYAVGFGNVWQFPMKAYQNGGGVFLVPYFVCSMVITFPVIFLEMSLGQFTNSGSGTIFEKLCPLFHGIGWGQAVICFLSSVYYNVLVAWTLIYLGYIIVGQWSQFARCDGSFNDEHCYSDQMLETLNIGDLKGKWFFYNRTAHTTDVNRDERQAFQNAAMQFFTKNVLKQSSNIDDPGNWNWLLFGALTIAWTLTALGLSKCVKWIRYLAYFTATVPYIVIFIFFVRSAFLPGARIGIGYYSVDSDFNRILDFEIWKQAAIHVCFSLSAGYGGLLLLTSVNEHSHNCFRDAAIVTVADAFLSVFGGAAVFAVLGSMAHQSGRKIEDVVDGGPGLAFIAYPEVASHMWASYIWTFLFFAMFFAQGISSQFSYTEVCCTAIIDQFPKLRKKRTFIVMVVCGVAYFIGLIFCHGAGIYWFNLFNEHVASVSITFIIALELIVVNHIYGYRNFRKDLISMFGVRLKGSTYWSKTKWAFSNIFGRSGLYLAYMMIAICPAVFLALGTYAIHDLVWKKEKYGKNKILAGWALAPIVVIDTAGIMAVIGVGIANVVTFRRNGKPWRSLIKVQKNWPKRKILPKKVTVEDSKSNDASEADGTFTVRVLKK